MEAKMAIVCKCIGVNTERKTVEILWITDNWGNMPRYVGAGYDPAPNMWISNNDFEEFCG